MYRLKVSYLLLRADKIWLLKCKFSFFTAIRVTLKMMREVSNWDDVEFSKLYFIWRGYLYFDETVMKK